MLNERPSNKVPRRDLEIRGLEENDYENETDLTGSFFAYSQKIDTPESFIVICLLSGKVSIVIFSKGG